MNNLETVYQTRPVYEDWVHRMCPSKSSEISMNFHMIWNSTIRWKNSPIWTHHEDSQIQFGDTTVILDIVIQKNIQVHQPQTNPTHAASSKLFPDLWCKSKNAYKILSVPLFLPAVKGACSGFWQKILVTETHFPHPTMQLQPLSCYFRPYAPYFSLCPLHRQGVRMYIYWLYCQLSTFLVTEICSIIKCSSV